MTTVYRPNPDPNLYATGVCVTSDQKNWGKYSLGLLALGRSHRAVARQTGHSRTTVLQYGREAGILKPPPSWKSRSARDAARAGNAGRSRCEPYRAFIEAEVLKGRQATRIYQDLVEHHGYSDSYEAVKRFVRTLQPKSSKVSTRFETLAGQDYVEYRVMLSPT